MPVQKSLETFWMQHVIICLYIVICYQVDINDNSGPAKNWKK